MGRLAMCVRSGPTVAAAPVPAIVWHIMQCWSQKHLLPALLALRQRRGRVCRCCSASSEILLRLRDDHKTHVRMLMPAEFGALPAKRSRLLRLEPQVGRMPGNQVFFPVEVRRPEAVNDIVRSQLEFHRAADRNVNLIGGLHVGAGAAALVFHLPPPLMPGDGDFDWIGIGGAVNRRGR